MLLIHINQFCTALKNSKLADTTPRPMLSMVYYIIAIVNGLHTRMHQLLSAMKWMELQKLPKLQTLCDL